MDNRGRRLAELDPQRLDHLDVTLGDPREHRGNLIQVPRARLEPDPGAALARVIQLQPILLGRDPSGGAGDPTPLLATGLAAELLRLRNSGDTNYSPCCGLGPMITRASPRDSVVGSGAEAHLESGEPGRRARFRDTGALDHHRRRLVVNALLARRARVASSCAWAAASSRRRRSVEAADSAVAAPVRPAARPDRLDGVADHRQATGRVAARNASRVRWIVSGRARASRSTAGRAPRRRA